MKVMKIIQLAAIALPLVCFASCNSDDENDNSDIPVVNKELPEDFTFTYGISLKNSSGNDLLDEKTDGHYAPANLYVTTPNHDPNTVIATALSEIPIDGAYQLLISVKAKGKIENPVYEMYLQWNGNSFTTIDTLRCSVKRTAESTYCKEIQVNGSPEWSDDTPGKMPLLTLEKRPQRIAMNPESIKLTTAQKVQSDNTFAFDIFKTTCAENIEKNNFISPLSISMALNMLLNGAEGDTKSEMLKTLRADKYSLSQINTYSQELRSALEKVDPNVSIAFANSIWYDKGFTLKENFVSTNQSNYDAAVQELDFSLPNAANTVNEWCAAHTNNRIPHVVDDISGNNAILANAIYFNAMWQTIFNKEATKEAEFHQEDGTTQTVNMMHNWLYAGIYASDANATYVELPYENGAYSMVIALPNDGKTTQDVIDNLSNDSWPYPDKMESKAIALSLPRFHAECDYSLDKYVLPAMGMKKPFSKDADFSGMMDFKPFFITGVIHKSYVNVNEEGTEAAAVTVILGVGAGEPLKYIEYNVNKPFLFAICEKSTGVILFMGKIGEVKEK